jgi:hypothetical protein
MNSSPIPKGVAARYAEEGAELLRYDQASCDALSVEVVRRPVATVENGYVRHHPGHLARELILLHAERSVRIAGDTGDTFLVERRKTARDGSTTEDGK